MGLAAAAIGATSQIAQGFSSYQASRYQGAVAKANQVIAERNAEQAVQRGLIDAQSQDLRNRAQLGSIAAVQGASGLDINTGSNLQVRESAAQLGRLDTETVMSNAQREAYAHKTEAMNFANQAKLAKAAGRNALIGGFIGGAANLASGIKPGDLTFMSESSSISPKWQRWRSY